MNKLEIKTEAIQTKDDFIGFLQLLVQNIKSHPEEWENKSLDSYLEGIASWTEDMEGYYQNNNLPIPQSVDWKLFANILMAAKMYE